MQIRAGWWIGLLLLAVWPSVSAQSSNDLPDTAVQAISAPREMYPIHSFSMDTIRTRYDWLAQMRRSLEVNHITTPSRLTRLGDFHPMNVDSVAFAATADSVKRSIALELYWHQSWQELCIEIGLAPDPREYYEQFRRTKPTYVKGSISFDALR